MKELFQRLSNLFNFGKENRLAGQDVPAQKVDAVSDATPPPAETTVANPDASATAETGGEAVASAKNTFATPQPKDLGPPAQSVTIPPIETGNVGAPPDMPLNLGEKKDVELDSEIAQVQDLKPQMEEGPAKITTEVEPGGKMVASIGEERQGPMAQAEAVAEVQPEEVEMDPYTIAFDINRFLEKTPDAIDFDDPKSINTGIGYAAQLALEDGSDYLEPQDKEAFQMIIDKAFDYSDAIEEGKVTISSPEGDQYVDDVTAWTSDINPSLAYFMKEFVKRNVVVTGEVHDFGDPVYHAKQFLLAKQGELEEAKTDEERDRIQNGIDKATEYLAAVESGAIKPVKAGELTDDDIFYAHAAMAQRQYAKDEALAAAKKEEGEAGATEVVAGPGR